MTINNDEDLRKLRSISRIVYETLLLMKDRMEIGMTTRELDDIGRANLDRHGARFAPVREITPPGTNSPW